MKTVTAFLFALLFMVSCSSDKKGDKAPAETTPSTTEQITPPPPPANQTTAGNVNVPAGADGIVHHYVCQDGHEGGFGEANSPCPVCGKLMAHNQAFHNQTSTNGDQPSVNLNQQNPPAQNASGQWHYTCPNGHNGSGATGACSQCGASLQHNQAYHQ